MTVRRTDGTLAPMPPTIPISPLVPPPSSDTRWHWHRLLSAPHRLAFFAAAVGLAGSALWWLGCVVAASWGIAVPWVVAPSLAHGLLMVGSFMPFFIVGFLFTAGPRWLGQPEVAARTLLWPVLAMGAGWLFALLGFHTSSMLAAWAVLVVSLGWGALLAQFLRLVRTSRVPDQLHARAVAGAGGLGLLALWLAVAGLGLEHALLLRSAVHVALWGWLAPTFAVVSHRMLPFFSAAAVPSLEAWRPGGVLLAMLALLVMAGAAEASHSLGWVLPWALQAVAAATLAVGGAALLALAVRWGLLHSLRGPALRLLAMLHGGFVWLGLTLLLSGLSQGLQAAGHAGLGLAPLHALTLGYLGATLVAMSTRVAAGHSGRPLAVDQRAWRLYQLLHLGVLLRLIAALDWVPAWPAALVWATVAVAWALRHGRWLGTPRADGRPD